MNISSNTFFYLNETVHSLRRWMESMAKGATTRALTKLIEMEPTTALLVESGESTEKEVEVQLLARGDVLKVRPVSTDIMNSVNIRLWVNSL